MKTKTTRRLAIVIGGLLFACGEWTATASRDAGSAASALQEGRGASSGPICDVTREIYARSPGPGTAAIVSVQYLGPGLRRREIHAREAKSDLGEKFRVRTSEDNGRTWTAFEPLGLGTDALRQGENFMEELSFAVQYDPASRRTIEILFRRVFLGDPEKALAAYWKGEIRMFDHCFYRLSADEGRTWTEPRQLRYEDGARFDPEHWAEPGFLAANQMYGGYEITPLSDGRIAYPAIVSVPYEEDAEDRETCRAVPWYAGRDRVYGVLCFIGAWRADKGDYDWTSSRPVWVKRRVSTRGFAEPALAELADGRLMMELRGSNVHLDPLRFPGRKWLSLSADGGRTWSPAADLRFDTGEQFWAPATFAKLIRSSRTGKLYWIGNISRGPAEGNGPRYPLTIAEIDERLAALKKSTLTVIDDRRPGDTAGLQLSNFSLLENRETGELEIFLTRLGERPDNVFSADAYKYTLKLR